MSIKLTDTQLVMLSAAAQRNDRCLVVAPNVKVAASQRIAGRLIAAGLVKEIRAKAGMPVWRRDDEARLAYALKLTASGRKRSRYTSARILGMSATKARSYVTSAHYYYYRS